jgi:2-polyprenyl-6-methoxyphenol hydroxylase-like FAD-dependent oxidoreductase
MVKPSVMIIGAGVGGLCLAQGLKLAGEPVAVFERDASGTSPVAGYRLSINATGSRALHSCLPARTFERLTMASGTPGRGLTILDHRLNRLLAFNFPRRDRRSVESERPIDRTVLRHVLLEGLDDVVAFGKTFVAFEDATDGRVTAVFSDGSRATADLLVGADGANSAVRRQLLPDARRVETGIVAVGGKLFLDKGGRTRVPEALLSGPTPILGPDGCFMFASAVLYGDLEEVGGSGASRGGDRADYLLWGFSARRARFGPGPAPEGQSGDELKRRVEGLMPAWRPELRSIVHETDPATVTAFAVKTATPVKPWKTRNVTLLGDALHNMPPYRGVGANTALWDAALLRETIVEAQGRPLLERLGEYERRMIDHGFRAVKTSLEATARFHSESRFGRALTKAFLRTLDRAPPLRAALMAAE